MKLVTDLCNIKGGERVSIKNAVDKLTWNKKMLIARTLAGLTQKGAAEKIGTTQKMVWAWETGRITPREASRKRIAKVYNVNYEELFQGLLPK
jgi:putative transcriptional regulator